MSDMSMGSYEEAYHAEPEPGACDLLDRLVAYLRAHRYIAIFHPADGRCVRMEPIRWPGTYHYLTLDELRQRLES